MRVLITDLIPEGECELSGKSNVECVRVLLQENAQEMTVTPAELVKLLRFAKKQEPLAATSKPSDKKGPLP